MSDTTIDAAMLPDVARSRGPRTLSLQMLREVTREALVSLSRNRVRAALSMLGISWGIVSVVVLMAYGSGFHRALAIGLLGAFDNGVVLARPGQTSRQAGGERAGRPVRLTLDDVAALQALPLVRRVSPEFVVRRPIAYGDRQVTQPIRGVDAPYGVMRSERPSLGRFINEEDVAQHRRVVFIGGELRRKLFGNRFPLGQTIRLAGIGFEVIGVLDDKVQLSTYYAPDRYCAFIPYTTHGQISDNTYPDVVVLQTADPMQQPRAIRQVREQLARAHRFSASDERAVRLMDSVENTRKISGMTDGLSFVLTFIGLLTLAIGGVGIMNIMFVSVTERTREIGVRKALGARRSQILLQFLLEGVFITFLGGVVGIALSSGIVWMVSPRPFLAELLDDTSRVSDIHLVLSGQLLVVSSLVLAGVGLLAGLLPAWRASRLDPIESLRYE